MSASLPKPFPHCYRQRTAYTPARLPEIPSNENCSVITSYGDRRVARARDVSFFPLWCCRSSPLWKGVRKEAEIPADATASSFSTPTAIGPCRSFKRPACPVRLLADCRRWGRSPPSSQRPDHFSCLSKRLSKVCSGSGSATASRHRGSEWRGKRRGCCPCVRK